MSGNGKSFLEQPSLHSKAPYRAASLNFSGNLQAALRESLTDPSKTLWSFGQGIPSAKVTKALVSWQPRPDLIWFDLEHGYWSKETVVE
jgi:4-hydroxy-2-oxoheptanedioate aldolase